MVLASSTASPTRQGLILFGFVLICLAAGAIGSLATAPQIPTWYASLEKPLWNPPSWVFGPVWTTLYVMMGISVWLVWRRQGSLKWNLTFGVFWLQLGLNTLWSILFFGLENPGLAFAEIVLLWSAIVWTIQRFAKHSALAAGLLIPYLGWVSFASYLNYTIWQLNS